MQPAHRFPVTVPRVNILSSPLLSSLVSSLVRLAPSRPPLRARRRVPGVSTDVRIDWTEGGVPHLLASRTDDLWFAQGYVTAAERLFQLDLARRAARGQLAELFGARPAPWEQLSVVLRGLSLVESDLFVRQLALGPAAAAALEVLSPESQQALRSYAHGVNAFIAEERWPLECQLLGYQPRPWTATDSLVVWKLLAFQLSYGWRAGLAAEAVKARFPEAPETVRALLPDQTHVTDTLVPRLPGAAFALKVVEGVAGKRGPGGPALGGSNGWAISGARTASGKVLLAGDPHLPLRAPPPGYLVHLHGPDVDVAGWSVPGVPGVLMGHNARVAWTVTSGCIRDATWALEQLQESGRAVRTATGSEPLAVDRSALFVRGEKAPREAVARHGPNGPLIEALPGVAPEGHALALRWTGHLATPDLDAVLAMNRAPDSAALQAAAQRYGSPAVNIVHGDVDGRIGWVLAGVAPRFHHPPPAGVVPGWLPEGEWAGLHGADELPTVVDPPEGFVVSANQKLLPNDASIQLGELFEPPYRARRLCEALGSRTGWTLPAACALQLDRRSGFGLELRRGFLEPLCARLLARPDRPQGTAAQVLGHATGWDGVADVDSPGAAAFWCFVPLLARQLLEPLLGEPTYTALMEQGNLPLLTISRLLTAEGAPLFSREQVDAAALASLVDAAKLLTKRCGKGPYGWRLGAFRTLTLRHPLGAVPGLRALVELGPVQHGGDGSTVDNATSRLSGDGQVDAGAVFRHAVVCGDWDDYRVVQAGGQSGDPASPRYRDHFDRWRVGDTFVLPFSRARVESTARETGWLLARD